MGDVTLRVGGFDTRLGCADGDEPRLLALGQMVDTHAQVARQLDPGTTEARMLLMAALMLADELGDARARLAEATADTDAPSTDDRRAADQAMADEHEALADRLEALAARWNDARSPGTAPDRADEPPQDRPLNWYPVGG